MARHRYTVQDLDAVACRRLLGSFPIGRVGFTDRALPRMLPVHCAVRNDEVVVAVRDGATLHIRSQEIVAFEVDAYDPATRQGWCVSLVGTCRVITDGGEMAELDALDFAPWASDEGSTYIGISISLMHGRALGAPAVAAQASSAEHVGRSPSAASAEAH